MVYALSRTDLTTHTDEDLSDFSNQAFKRQKNSMHEIHRKVLDLFKKRARIDGCATISSFGKAVEIVDIEGTRIQIITLCTSCGDDFVSAVHASFEDNKWHLLTPWTDSLC
jgi:hypothetical protein